MFISLTNSPIHRLHKIGAHVTKGTEIATLHSNISLEVCERAAQRFLELRGEASVARHRDGLLAIAAELSALRAQYPDSAHAAEIGKHIERVQRELEALPEP